MSSRIHCIVTIIVMLYTAYSFGANYPYAAVPPGKLATSNVPQFVVLGSDDNTIDTGVQWITNYLTTKSNPAGNSRAATFDGAPVHMDFYLIGYAADSLTSPKIVEAWKAAYQAGHEIGNHTYDHVLNLNDPNQAELNGYKFSTNTWYNDMIKADTVIAKALGIPNDSIPFVIKGFRTPRLEYNDSTFLAIQKRGFGYDCSVEEGYEDGENYTYGGSTVTTPDQTCGDMYWPFTLDNGSQSDQLNLMWWKDDPSGWTFISCGQVPGLWEVPIYCWVLPDSAYAASHGANPHIRDTAAKHVSYLADGGYKVTGFDFNLLAIYDDGSYAMDSADYYTTMKYNFDKCFAGNRRPFTFNIHTDECFPDSTDTEDNPNITPLQRRQCIEGMIDYMLSKPDVRFVTASQLIAWMQAPVGLDGTIGAAIKIPVVDKTTSPFAVKSVVKGTLVFSASTPGTYAVRLFNVNGTLVRTAAISAKHAGEVSTPLKGIIASGIYLVKISAPNGVIKTARVVIE
jgi:peptidoglycan/xylan/chitin deacetylase (PgdA/CDA1 family)